MNTLRRAFALLGRSGLPDGRLWTLIVVYYLLTPLGAAVDGLAWLQLVRLVAEGSAPSVGALDALLATLGAPTPARVGALFLSKATLTLTLALIDTRMGIIIRSRLQVFCLESVVFGRWDALRGGQVGRWTGALTEEIPLLSKLYTSVFGAAYHGMTAALLAVMAIAVAPSLALGLTTVAVPSWLLLRAVYKLQTRLARSQSDARQGMAADLNETLSGLFQAKASGETGSLERRALRHQGEVFARESQLGWTLGLLTSFNSLVMGIVLVVLETWGVGGSVASLGGVGVLAFRAATSVNALVATLGNLTRFAGSLDPLEALARLPPELPREPLGERLASARLENVTYSQGGRRVLDGAAVSVEPGRLLLVTGPSGAGKTTLINLLAGLYTPEVGRVVYRGSSGAEHDAASRRVRVAYVAQDVHLFSGTVRENLDPEGRLGDDALWRALERAGAADFVRARGGLGIGLAEAGRSLSGGERRRLAVARALAHKADLLALDEVTNGLDEASKAALVANVAALARELPIVAVTHDAAAFAPAEPRVYSLDTRPDSRVSP